eukprot:scaffold12.g8125.t1
MGEQAAPKSKLEEQATAKADLSYSYWAANAASSVPPPEPKLLTEEELKAQCQKHTEVGHSAWNRAGTFEERNVTEFAKAQLGILVRGVERSEGGVSVRFSELASCSGEAHQWIVRHKKRAGFEFRRAAAATGGGAAGRRGREHCAGAWRVCCSLPCWAQGQLTKQAGARSPWRSDVQLKWTAEVEEVAISGTARVAHAAADELDDGLSLTDVLASGGEGDARARAEAAVLGLLPGLEAALRQLVEVLKQK